MDDVTTTGLKRNLRFTLYIANYTVRKKPISLTLNNSFRLKRDIPEGRHSTTALIRSNLNQAGNCFIQGGRRYLTVHILITNHKDYAKSIFIYTGKSSQVHLI